MRTLNGRKVFETDVGWLLDTLRPARVVVDLGTGDGKAVLARAAREPDALVLGIDPDARAMAEASRRAGRPP